LPSSLLAGLALAYACTLLYFAARLAWGLVETRALARTATRVTFTGEAALRWTRCCQRLGITARAPEIAASPHAIGPVTIGFRRSLLLLPPAFLENVTPDDLHAVLAHELAHIRRRDFAKNLLYGLVSLPIAWHPLLWRTRASVSESRELVCDAIAADAIAPDAVAGRKQYAQSLLRLAAMLISRRPVRALHAIGIFNLSSDPRTFERRIMVLTHRRTPISVTRGVVIAAACAILALATCTSAVALRTDVAALTPTTETAAPAKIHVKAGIMAGQKIAGENPTYPPEARAKKIQGTVVLALTIDKDGAPQEIHVTKSPDQALADSAIKAVRTWRWRPYLLNGNPTAVDTTVNVTYHLEG
jgi:TonB family protein